MGERPGYPVTIEQAASHFRVSTKMIKRFATDRRIMSTGPEGNPETRYDLDSFRDEEDQPPRGPIERTTHYAIQSEAIEALGITRKQFLADADEQDYRFIRVGSYPRRVVEWTDDMEARCQAQSRRSPIDREDHQLTTDEIRVYLSINNSQFDRIHRQNLIDSVVVQGRVPHSYYLMTTLFFNISDGQLGYNPNACWLNREDAIRVYNVSIEQFNSWVNSGRIQRLRVGLLRLVRYNVHSFSPNTEDYVILPGSSEAENVQETELLTLRPVH